MAINFLGQHLYIGEPELSFHYSERRYKTFNPLEGILRWGPYDASIPGFSRPNPIKLAIISTDDGFNRVVTQLRNLNSNNPPVRSDEYLKIYPGFRNIYQTNLSFPERKTDNFLSLISHKEIVDIQSDPRPEIAFLELLKKHIKTFISERHLFDILIVHIPSEASQYRKKIELDYRYDLHDSLKAYCAPIGIKIQLLEDKSFHYFDLARVCWWLSLALYVKANGLPWRLADSTPQTAYIGLTFGIKPGTMGQKIVLGCSQIFDEYGEGIKFILFPLENPVWHKENPFMDYQDARRLFTIVRDTYQKINCQRPKKIVVHKTTYFSSDEIKGISEALEGIEEIDLITIQQNTHYKAIMFDSYKQEISKFPVSRTIALPLDTKCFLLWTQGDVLGVALEGRHYYQEKRGIPTPLVITKYRGRSSIEEVAYDILKLTKMNWNNFQLYNRLPADLTFAARIADIVKQIETYTPVPQDFRYFI